LTQEDWHEVLYMGMANTSAWAALYFILLMTFGNYVLFNLLVAILVEGFSAQAEVNSSTSVVSYSRVGISAKISESYSAVNSGFARFVVKVI